MAAIEEVFVGERIRVAQDPLPVEAQAGEELWIIATPTQTDQAIDADDDTMPGTGAMLASFLPDEHEAAYQSEIPLPLKHTDVQARIVGYVGTVDVTQQFENPFDRKIEAVYVFPLPEKAAISEFVTSIGERRIRGILREREEAEAIYSEARAQGYQASLLVQRRPNIFEQKVANIEPG
ncbi:MAG: VIT domain-containing protein, partial [Rhodospirillaceae bacterium]|nr:VIT domain-containing protein [Rhodospirillaceae bacterium]